MVIFGSRKYKIGQDASENSEQKTDLDTQAAFTQDICQSLKLERQQHKKLIRKISISSKEI